MAVIVTGTPVATAYSYQFVRDQLPKGARSVLEIGCGDGELAARFVEDGLRVVALDSEEACVATARTAGVDARLATWPATVNDAFDTVLFTRSLHHIAPLDEAVAAAVAALAPDGRIIVEDFRIEAESVRTDAWYKGLLRSLEAGQVPLDDAAVDRLLEKLDFGEHRHELHSSIAIAEALGRHGELRQADAAYYFRYLEGELREPQIANSGLEQELAAIEAGQIDPLGKRFVLTPRH